MSVRFFVLLLLLIKLCILGEIEATIYEQTVTFSVFNNQTGDSFVSSFNTPLACDRNGKFAFVIHGWEDRGQREGWVMDIIGNLSYHRGGCVIFMDYSRYSSGAYSTLVRHFHALSRVLTKKIRQATDNFENVFLYGFSFGARLAFESGATIGYQKIERIDACDPAGPAFDGGSPVDPKFAAKNVYCINTSQSKGTQQYDCHINFRMGVCGVKQLGATKKPCGSHGLCPYYYNAAFEHEFHPNNFYNCTSSRMATNIPSDFRMGYMESRNSFLYYGDIFIATTKSPPWNVVNNDVLL